MKRNEKKFTRFLHSSNVSKFLVVSAFALFGCANHADDNHGESLLNSRTTFMTSSDMRHELLNEAMYHDETKSWLVPINDPYKLENCQKAYDNIASGSMVQTMIDDGNVSEFSLSVKLEATHYALKIYPRNEDEQMKISAMKDVMVSYQPFDYTTVSDESEINYLLRNRSNKVYDEGNRRYTVTYSDLMTLEGPADPVTYKLPVLYVVWPATKQLPASFDHEVLYSVFLPNSNDQVLERSMARSNVQLSAMALRLLDEEAKALAFNGTSYENKVSARSTTPVLVAGRIKSYDNIYKQFVPLHNLKVRLQLGTFVKDLTVGIDGSYFYREYMDRNTTMTLLFQRPEFYIAYEGSASPITFSLGTLGSREGNMDINIAWAGLGGTYACEAFRAANNYYYNSSAHNIPIMTQSGGIRIEASNVDNSSAAGHFFYSGSDGKPFIRIYKSAGRYPIGTTLHEIGHFVHYSKRGYSNMINTESIITESYASYVGWHMSLAHYKSLGYTGNERVSNNDRQEWPTSGAVFANYTPIFVDLIDDYNQNYFNNNGRVNDNIKNVPHAIVDRIINESNNMVRCRQILQSYVGIYYTQKELNDMLELY